MPDRPGLAPPGHPVEEGLDLFVFAAGIMPARNAMRIDAVRAIAGRT